MARRLALLVGNRHFDDETIFPPLRTPANDVEDLARALQEFGDFEILGTLIDETDRRICRAVEELCSAAHRGDLVLFYYSGHGYRGRMGNYYLAAKNSRKDRMKTSSIPAFFLHSVMKSSLSRHRVIILDCCFSGAFIKDRKGIVEPLSLSKLRGEAEAILASSSFVQYSFEHEGRNSLFTQALVHGIATGEADDNGDGLIDIDELFNCAARRVQESRPEQTPEKDVNIRGSELVIARTSKGPVRQNAQETRFQIPFIELNFPNPVREEKDFYGRSEELLRIEQTLLAPSRRSVNILGERRIGKTSLQRISILRGKHAFPEHVVFLPRIRSSTTRRLFSMSDLAREILHLLCDHLQKDLRETGLLDPNGQLQIVSNHQFEDVMTKLLEDDHNRKIVISIDEFDTAIFNCSKNQQEVRRILALMGYLIDAPDLPVSVYLTMTRMPNEIESSFSSPSITQSDVILLEPFSSAEAQDMVHGLLGGRIEMAETAQERMFRLSGGHPYFVKLLLDRLVARYWGDGTPLSISQGMIDDVVLDATEDPRALPAIENIYDVHFRREERALVLLLADRGAALTADELRSLGAVYVGAAKALQRRGYLLWDEEDSCDFRIEFLGWWLREWERFEVEKERLGVQALQQRKLDVDILIDEATKEVLVRGNSVNLTLREYQVLTLLCRHAGIVVSRDQLARELWPEVDEELEGQDAAIDQIVSRLRGKLGDKDKIHIKTVRGQGLMAEGCAFADMT